MQLTIYIYIKLELHLHQNFHKFWYLDIHRYRQFHILPILILLDITFLKIITNIVFPVLQLKKSLKSN